MPHLNLLYIILLMQNYQQFWNNQIGGQAERQLHIDWDVFIHNFTEGIAKQANYQLNSIQKEYIKSKIDPKQRNEIYKSAFLLFAKNYWDLPSNRTNLFKMKMNLTNVLPRFSLMTGADPQQIFITIRYKNDEGNLKHIQYLFKENNVHLLDQQKYEISQKRVHQNGFVTIGESQKNDISVNDCMYLNKYHLKIASIKYQKQVKKRMMYEQKEPEPLIITEWYIKDIAKSNRVKYLLDNPWKYVFVKPGMVLSIGYTEDIEIIIKKIGFGSADVVVPKIKLEQIDNLLNADRINFMGEIDPKVPLKTLLDLDFKEVTIKQIEQMYQEGIYYPQSIQQTTEKGKPGKEEIPSITFQIVNKQTFTKKQYTCYNSSFTIGRCQSCTYRLQDISIRKKQVIFQCINNFWTVRGVAENRVNLDINYPSVYIGSLNNIIANRHSNRFQLKQGSTFVLRGKNFDVQIELKEPPVQEEEY